MHAMFVAHGPFSTNVKDVHSKRSVWQSVRRRKSGFHSISDEATVLDGFQNVQVYGLVMKLLGIERWSASNNGTKAFWDKYY